MSWYSKLNIVSESVSAFALKYKTGNYQISWFQYTYRTDLNHRNTFYLRREIYGVRNDVLGSEFEDNGQVQKTSKMVIYCLILNRIVFIHSPIYPIVKCRACYYRRVWIGEWIYRPLIHTIRSYYY
jgi:hypothetical protein